MSAYVQGNFELPRKWAASFVILPSIFQNTLFTETDRRQLRRLNRGKLTVAATSQKVEFELHFSKKLMTRMFSHSLNLPCFLKYAMITWIPCWKSFNSFTNSAVNARNQNYAKRKSNVFAETIKLIANISRAHQYIHRSRHSVTNQLNNEC